MPEKELAMSAAKPILLDIAEGVATVTINRPQAKNSLDVEALSQLLEALGTCEDRSDVGAVVLTGAGDAFCASTNARSCAPVSGKWRCGGTRCCIASFGSRNRFSPR
jgi:enoyl-CoA hydratase/carnithine racemase